MMMRKLIVTMAVSLIILFDLPVNDFIGNIAVASSPNQATLQSGAGEVSWSMAGANPQRTSWVPEGVDPEASDDFGVEWYRPIEAYIGQHVQLVTARDKVYVSTARGVYALDAGSGDEVWRFDTEMPIGHSPTVVGNVLYVGGFDKRVYSLNADTGGLIWTFTGAKGGFSTNPLVIEGKVLLGSRDGYFYALDQNNGNLLWQYPASSEDPLGPILYSAAYKDGQVFFAANDNYAYSLDVNTGALIWKSEKMPGDGYQAWWPVVFDDYVVFSGALGYATGTDPGAWSIINVVDQNDPYYAQMHNFQYDDFVVKTFQRDDVFHQGEAYGSLLGPEFQTGSSGDNTGIQWSWGSGKSVVDASKVTEYLENDGQVRTNRPTNKPWRRGVIVLNVMDGTEYTFDSDNDGHPEYSPFLFVGVESGNRYPPLIIPTKDDQGSVNEVMYAQNFHEYRSGYSISRAKLMGWQVGTPYLYPIGGNFAIDEPFANSAGGSILYDNLCCDRQARWVNLETEAGGNFWSYHKTLESIKLDWSEIESWMVSLAPGYDEMWQGASMWTELPRLVGQYGTINGIYHNHTIQNPLIPYRGRLFVHRSNAIIALGPNPVFLRRQTQNETPEEYEANIRQEYPQVSRPLLKINEPDQDLDSTLRLEDIQNNLDYQITKMLQKGHLRPGYYNGTMESPELANYFENPGDTLYTLSQAYPYVSESIQPDLEKYIKQHYKMYFENEMYVQTGFWIDRPNNYDLNQVDGFGQLQPREWMPLPPEVAESIKEQQANIHLGYSWRWPWNYPQHNLYAMWKFAETFYSNDPAKLEDIYNNAKEVLDTDAPDEDTLHEKPWVHNAYIAGYIGFLNLQDLAGKAQEDASLRSSIETELNSLLALRSNDFRKDHPWVDDFYANRKLLNVARNFMNMTPELGDYLNKNAYDKVKEAVDEYHWVAAYWVATRYEASLEEFSSDNLYTHSAMFQAKAYALKEPVDQLLKYIDAPAFETGDLFYIQNLVGILSSTFEPSDPTPTPEPTLDPTPTPTPEPTLDPTSIPTNEPTAEPTNEPTSEPTSEPTPQQPVPLILDGPTSVESGGTLEMNVIAQNVPTPGLYGVQFEINYDPSLISVSDLQVNPNLPFVVLNRADNTTGKITLVASEQGKVSGLTGDVTLLSFQATAADTEGTVTFGFENEKFSDFQAQGFDITVKDYSVTIGQGATPEPTQEPTSEPTNQPTPEPTIQPTPTSTLEPTPTPTSQPTSEPTAPPTTEPTSEPTPQPTNADLSGQVVLAGRSENNWSGATVVIDNGDQNTVTDKSGNFNIPNLAPGLLNSVTADASGYLSAVCLDVTVTAPETILAPVTLLSGDITDDDLVDIVDATAVGASFGQTGQDLVADITLDEVVDIFDIVLVSVNFGEEGPQAWNCLNNK
jgi:outer membrane biosynthesis protein TonB